MNPRLLNWILAGALAGCLALLGRSWARPEPRTGEPACSPASCALDLGRLDLSAEQRERLSALCPPEACAPAGASGTAQASCAALLGALADPDADAEGLRARARELAEYRSRELERCVETILEVRKVLSPEQVAALLEDCCARGEM